MSGVMAMEKWLLFSDDVVAAPIASDLAKGKVEPTQEERRPGHPRSAFLLAELTPSLLAIAITAVAVVHRELHALLEPLETCLEFARFARIEAAAGAVMQPA